jgi:membrane fusion protein (multidrug efflux system)
MRMSALIVAASLMTAASAQEKPVKEQVEESAKKVKELQKERVATLKELVDQAAAAFKSARASYDELLEARRLLLKAELDAAEKESERITIYKKTVDALKESEALANARVKAGRGSHATVLKIKAMRLEVELLLEQAKVKMPGLEHHKVVVTSPKAKDVIITQPYACRVHSQRHINVRALANGYIKEISVKEGQAVKKGDVIFKVEPTLYQAKYDAELAEVRLAEIELNNIKKLFERKVVSSEEVALYQAKLAKAQAKAKLAEAEMNFTIVKAPFDGIVGRFHEKPGSLINERDILTTLSDNRVMWVYFNVPVARYLEYMAGRGQDKEAPRIELVLATGSKFPKTGMVGAIEAQFNENGNIPFRADFPNPGGLLRHGMTGNVLVHRTLNNAIVIPQRATFEILGKRYVYVVDKEGVVHQREVVVQNEVEDSFVINRGVGVDDRVIFEGIRQVRDGEKVEYEFRPPR